MESLVIIGSLVKAKKEWRRRFKGVYKVKEVDGDCVTLESLASGRPLYFGLKTFSRYWELIRQVADNHSRG